jgi:hypothetical protein
LSLFDATLIYFPRPCRHFTRYRSPGPCGWVWQFIRFTVSPPLSGLWFLESVRLESVERALLCKRLQPLQPHGTQLAERDELLQSIRPIHGKRFYDRTIIGNLFSIDANHVLDLVLILSSVLGISVSPLIRPGCASGWSWDGPRRRPCFLASFSLSCVTRALYV